MTTWMLPWGSCLNDVFRGTCALEDEVLLARRARSSDPWQDVTTTPAGQAARAALRRSREALARRAK